MAADLTALTVDQLDMVRRDQHAAAQTAWLQETASGLVQPSPAGKRRVDRITRMWEATLAEYERRGLLVGD